MNQHKTQYMAFMAMFLAIEVVLVLTPLGYIQLGVINATTMHIPVLIAGIALGKKAGAQLGFVFGLTSLLNATFRPGPTSFVFSPFITIGGISGNFSSIFIALVPRILVGFLAGLVFEQLQKHKVNQNVSILSASVIGTLTNTVLVLAGIYLFFGPQYAQVTGVSYQALIGVLLAVITTNGIGEIIVGCIATLVVCKAIAPFIKKIKHN